MIKQVVKAEEKPKTKEVSGPQRPVEPAVGFSVSRIFEDQTPKPNKK